MDRIWLKSYPSGVPTDIAPPRHTSLVTLLDDSLRAHRNRDAFPCAGKAVTYGELDLLSSRLAAWLQNRELPSGSRVVPMMPNLLPHPVAIAAVLRGGYSAVNANPLYTPRELARQLKDSGAEAIIVLENFAATVETVIERASIKHVIVPTAGDLTGTTGVLIDAAMRYVKKSVTAWTLRHTRFIDAMAQGRHLEFTSVRIDPDDVAFPQYTGGTTGVSKGAALLHRNVVANILQLEAWRKPLFDTRPNNEVSTTVVALPPHHIYALTACYFLSVQAGGTGILIPAPRNLDRMIHVLSGHAISAFPGVNTLYNALLHQPQFGRLDFSRLLIATGGGMPIQGDVASRRQAKTQVPATEAYGLSETSPAVTANPVNITKHNGRVGLPLPSTDISIRDDAWEEIPLGQPGEVCIRGLQVMAGYWNRPEETVDAMTADGFFKSGDIGILDANGYLRTVDRKKDMILVSGFNVYPNEIEDVVASHPGVFEADAIGVPDSHPGESVKLFVVKQDQGSTKQDVHARCRANLTAYKCPRLIEFRTELPKSNVGKILRRELREMIEARDNAPE
ncbi:AMP-binding protein [Burkholderia gladioli]|uniref:AMP-binding protein n=1 Tax=Burkholderia gladioli TaxID=28095 RepID=UPI003B9879EE